MRTWSEKNGRTDVKVYGFSPLDNIVAVAAGLIMLAGCILVIAGLS